MITDKASLLAQTVKNLPAMQETHVRYLGLKDPLQEEMVTHASILTWKTPWTEESGGLQYIGSDTTEQLSMHIGPEIILDSFYAKY